MQFSKAEQAYWDALKRLQVNKANIVDTKSSRFKFTNDAIGREAGKGKGYVRNERYPELCEAIKKAEEERKKSIPDRPTEATKLKYERELKVTYREKYDQLKREYDLLMNDYLNILRHNFELQSDLTDSTDIELVKNFDN